MGGECPRALSQGQACWRPRPSGTVSRRNWPGRGPSLHLGQVSHPACGVDGFGPCFSEKETEAQSAELPESLRQEVRAVSLRPPGHVGS